MPTKISTTAGDRQTARQRGRFREEWGEGRQKTLSGSAGVGVEEELEVARQLVSQPLWRIRNIYFWQPERMFYVPAQSQAGKM